MALDFGRRSRLAGVTQILDDRRKEQLCALADVRIDGVERGVDRPRRFLRIEHLGVDHLEELRIEPHGLWHHLAIGEQATPDDLDLRERGRGVQNPQRRVVEIGPRHEPLVGLVNAGERAGRGVEELELGIAIANAAQM